MYIHMLCCGCCCSSSYSSFLLLLLSEAAKPRSRSARVVADTPDGFRYGQPAQHPPKSCGSSFVVIISDILKAYIRYVTSSSLQLSLSLVSDACKIARTSRNIRTSRSTAGPLCAKHML